MGKQNTVLIERLRLQMQRKNINARELAERAEVGRSFVYDLLSGKSTNPTTQKLSAIADVLSVSVLYLMGETENPINASLTAESLNDVVAIPSLVVETSLSGGAMVTEENDGDVYYFRRQWVKKKLGAQLADLRIIFVKGDSMAPSLNDGDMVLINLKERSPEPAGIFAIFDGRGLVVKRLENASGSTALLRVISDNAQYGAYERPVNDVHIVGRVVWFAREL